MRTEKEIREHLKFCQREYRNAVKVSCWGGAEYWENRIALLKYVLSNKEE